VNPDETERGLREIVWMAEAVRDMEVSAIVEALGLIFGGHDGGSKRRSSRRGLR
jgi:hypothetical protein